MIEVERTQIHLRGRPSWYLEPPNDRMRLGTERPGRYTANNLEGDAIS